MPELRFPEFTDGWISKKVSSIAQVNPKTNSIPDVFQYIDLESVNKGVLTEHKIINVTDAPSRAQRLLEKNDILFQTVRPYQQNNYFFTGNNIPTVASTGYAQIKAKINPYYLYQLLHSKSFLNEVMLRCTGSSYPAINGNDLKDITISYSSDLFEQEKISNFFKYIDSIIEKQQQLIDKLKLYKRGLINQIFDNKLSFSKKSEWHKYQLSDILKERKTYCEKDGTYEHATLSKEGVYGKTDRYERDYLVSSDDKKYKITKLGDICYNPANLKFGVICLNTCGDAIFSPIYITFEVNKKFNKEFLAFCLTRNDFINKALQYQQGTVYERMAVSPEDLLSMSINLPPKDIQDSLAKVILKIEDKVSKTEMKLTELKQMRIALLQKMFI